VLALGSEQPKSSLYCDGARLVVSTQLSRNNQFTPSACSN